MTWNREYKLSEHLLHPVPMREEKKKCCLDTWADRSQIKSADKLQKKKKKNKSGVCVFVLFFTFSKCLQWCENGDL